ncbi:MAG: PLP-dependent aminotransferase family protein [Steroidobacteraceae bacterium]
MTGTSAPVYARIADELARLIESAALRPGERLPSVRRLALQKRISATTAVASLRSLERRGLIEARPQSGYFVRPRAQSLAEPRLPRPRSSARQVGVSGLITRLNEASLDPRVVPLGAAIPDADLFPGSGLRREVALVARSQPRALTDYVREVAGLPALRHEIVRHYAQLGCELHDEELSITNGCTEALNLALRAVARAGDTIAVESPTYFGFLQIYESLGLKVLELPTHPRDGLVVEALQERLASRGGKDIKACVVIANFSNPTGATLPDARKRQLVQTCARAGIALIEDDIYGDLPHGSMRPLPAKAFDDHGGVILCSSFSKTLAPGARIGFVSGARWTDDIRALKSITSVATPLLLQQALANFLRAGRYARHLPRLRRAFAEQVARVTAAVEAAFPAGTRLSRPQGGFVLWVELPGAIDTLAVYEHARAEQLDFAPGPLFSPTAGRYRNCLRLNCGQKWNPQTERALMRLGALLHRSLG